MEIEMANKLLRLYRKGYRRSFKILRKRHPGLGQARMGYVMTVVSRFLVHLLTDNDEENDSFVVNPKFLRGLVDGAVNDAPYYDQDELDEDEKEFADEDDD